MSSLTNSVVTICPIEQAAILALRQCSCSAGARKETDKTPRPMTRHNPILVRFGIRSSRKITIGIKEQNKSVMQMKAGLYVSVLK